MNGQIALDYLIIFNAVMFLFVVIFVVVAYQRGQAVNQQTFSQLQIIAQTLAQYVNNAAGAGNGYSVHLALPSSIGIPPYNVSVSTSGLIVVTVHNSGQLIQATSYSLVKRIISSQAYASPSNPSLYNLPVANGSIELQNQLGNICVDYQCPLPNNRSSALSLAEQLTHGALFSGSSYITVPTFSGNIKYSAAKGVSVCMWFDAQDISATQPPFIQSTRPGGSTIEIGLLGSGAIGTNAFTHPEWITAGGAGGTIVGTSKVYPNTWYFICGTWDPGSAKSLLYVNGALDTQGSASFDPNAQVANIQFGGGFNGIVTNVQVYNSSLSNTLVLALYNNGITGSPVANSIVGWWRLDGDTYDSSGYGDSGTPVGSVPFVSVAQLSATVTNQSGSALNNSLVGFEFSSSNSFSSYTNSNGIATKVFSPGLSSGYTFVRATSFPLNGTLPKELIAWWPLDLGNGNSAAAFTGGANTQPGMIYNALWAHQNFVASFDGRSGYVNLGIPKNYNKQAIGLSFWVRPRGPLQQVQLTVSAIPISVYDNQWSFVAFTFDGSTEKVYLNGALYGSVSSTANTWGVIGPSFVVGSNQIIGPSISVNCSISDIQLYNTALSSGQISGLYSEGLFGAPLPISSLIGLWPMGGDAADYSGNGGIASLSGGVSFTPAGTFGAPSNSSAGIVASFAGNGYVTGNALYSAVPSGFAWIYPTQYPATISYIMSFDGAAADPDAFGAGLSSGGNVVVLDYGLPVTSQLVVPLNQWSLIGFSVDATYATAYLNNQKSAISHAAIKTAQGKNWTIGSGTAALGFYTGYLTNVQVYNSTPGIAQINNLFSHGPYSAPLQNAGLLGWYPLSSNTATGSVPDYSGTGLSNNGYAHNVNYNNFVIGALPVPNPLGDAGISMNGGTSILATSSGAFSQPSGAMSMFAWVNLNSQASALVQKTGSYGMKVGVAGAAPGQFAGYVWGITNGVCGSYPYTLSKGTWYFVGFTYDGTSVTEYVNGQLYCRIPVSGSVPQNKNPIAFGGPGDTDGYVNGILADVQIYNASLSSDQVLNLYLAGQGSGSAAAIPLGVVP